jgi:hypothetical protein
MDPITLTIGQIPKPSGVVPARYRIGMFKDGTLARDYAGDAPAVTFTDVPSGTYTVFAERLSSTNAVIGTRVQGPYTVVGEMVDVPIGIMVGSTQVV